jgi:hypothetical protein
LKPKTLADDFTRATLERFSRQWFLVQLLKTCARGATSCSWVLTKETAPARNWRWQGHIRYIVDSTRRLEQASYRNSNSNRATRSAKVPCESLTTPQFPSNLPPNLTAGLFQQFSVRSSCSPDPQECTKLRMAAFGQHSLNLHNPVELRDYFSKQPQVQCDSQVLYSFDSALF